MSIGGGRKPDEEFFEEVSFESYLKVYLRGYLGVPGWVTWMGYLKGYLKGYLRGYLRGCFMSYLKGLAA